MYEEVLKMVRTQDDATKLDDELDELLVAVYKTGDEFGRVMKGRVREVVAEVLSSEMRGDPGEQADYLRGLKKEIEGLPTMRMKLAFWPSRGFIERLSDWVKENVGAKVLLEVVREEELIGGTVIDYEGKYGDYSVSKTLREFKFTDEAGRVSDG